METYFFGIQFFSLFKTAQCVDLPFSTLQLKVNKFIEAAEMFLIKGALKICSKFTGEDPCRTAISIKLQSPSAWVFSCKFAAYFQNTFS